MKDLDLIWEYYKEYLLDDKGQVDISKLKSFLLENEKTLDAVSEVYSYITNGRVSKPCISPSTIISYYDDIINDIHDETIKECLDGILDDEKMMHKIISKYRKLKIKKI